MTNRTHLGVLILLLAASQAGCEGATQRLPTAPTATQPQPAAGSTSSVPALLKVMLSGVVYEKTPMGRAPIAGVDVYCEPCGVETHSWAKTDSDGFYSFTWVWVDGIPTGIWIGKDGFADPAGLPALTPPNPSGPGWREVTIDGDTRFDIQLVRQ